MYNNEETPYSIITGQQLSIDDIVTEVTETEPENTDNEFGSRGYDKQFDGAYAD